MQNKTTELLPGNLSTQNFQSLDWRGLLVEVHRLKEELCWLSGRYSINDLSGVDALQNMSCPSESFVVSSLRTGLSPTVIYHVLKQYAVANRHNPAIKTDRGKILFIDYNSKTQKLSLFIGAESEWCQLDDSAVRKHYVLGLEERHDFVSYGNKGYVSQTRFTRQQLVERLGKSCTGRGSYLPALYYSVSDDYREVAECCQRTELMSGAVAPGATGVSCASTASAIDDPKIRSSRYDYPLLGVKNKSCAPGTTEPGSRLRQVADPRNRHSPTTASARLSENNHRLGDIPDDFWAKL